MYQFRYSDFGNQMIFNVYNQSWIPMDPANSDYQAYLAWVAEGNTAEQWQSEGM